MKKIFLLMLIANCVSDVYAYTLNFGVFGATDSREEVEDNTLYGFSAAVLWGGSDFRAGLGAHKGLERINEKLGGYETFTLNFQYAGFYLNPFYGVRAVDSSKGFDSDNTYRTQGVVFGYDYLVTKSISLGVMGIYEDPAKLDKDKENEDYIQIESTLSPAFTVKYWWW